jgi:hypothetical protein
MEELLRTARTRRTVSYLRQIEDAKEDLVAERLNESEGVGGPDRDRTGDLMNAIHARSQLRHRPTRQS